MISKDRNFSSYNYCSIPGFFARPDLISFGHPVPESGWKENDIQSNPNPKNFICFAGLDSKIRILFNTDAYGSESSLGRIVRCDDITNICQN